MSYTIVYDKKVRRIITPQAKRTGAKPPRTRPTAKPTHAAKPIRPRKPAHQTKPTHEAKPTRQAKLFMNGRSQAVRLPAEYRFEGNTVFIRKDQTTGDVILSARPTTWDDFFTLRDLADVPEDFLSDRGDDGPPPKRELF